ncbi:hypothetical protein GLAREA_11894 [Glarea lozoyensis ATCC 20868]|uniref:Uncharacterized protein n=1 Tax=Glarea lozoyensis (strain ATCC 20868 / MF5171) TaxID=1116229 RepID=S3CZY5_GLAL2|nr:uncharacterized protein GLAREA_11894 [Glarea lozoyensis ATCC 20868]EPE31812.1 hypothetical protein GLAREA_11894 [Glarea lozoyensis ATCC 20868]
MAGSSQRGYSERVAHYLRGLDEPDLVTATGITRSLGPLVLGSDVTDTSISYTNRGNPTPSESSDVATNLRRSHGEEGSSDDPSDTAATSLPSFSGGENARKPLYKVLRNSPPSNVVLHQCDVTELHHHNLGCEFHYLDCHLEFPMDQLEDWVAHTANHFSPHEPPEMVHCNFCPEVFRLADTDQPRFLLWRDRMLHVRTHLPFQGSCLSHSQKIKPDSSIVRYLVSKDLLSRRAGDSLLRSIWTWSTKDENRAWAWDSKNSYDDELRAHEHDILDKEKRFALRKRQRNLDASGLRSRNKRSLRREDPHTRSYYSIVQIHQPKGIQAEAIGTTSNNSRYRLSPSPTRDFNESRIALEQSNTAYSLIATFTYVMSNYPGSMRRGCAVKSTLSRDRFDVKVGRLIRVFAAKLSMITGARSKGYRDSTACKVINDLAHRIAVNVRERMEQNISLMSASVGKSVFRNDNSLLADTILDKSIADIAGATNLIVPMQMLCDLVESFHGLYFDGRKKIAKIREIVNSKNLRQLGDEVYAADLQMDWDIPKFVNSQYGKKPSPAIESFITISGSALYCQALTCGDYLKQTWGGAGEKVLSILQASLNEPTGEISEQFTHWAMTVRQGRSKISLTGGEIDIQIAVEILVWLAAVFTINQTTETCYSEAFIKVLGNGDLSIDNFQAPFVSAEKLCWLHLFGKPVVAREFPIAERCHELGIEIHIRMASALISADHAVEYNGGIVVKGFSSILVPIEASLPSVRWHLISNTTGKLLKYSEVDLICPQRLSITTFNQQDILQTRAFIAWSDRAESYLGTNMVKYETITTSGAGRLGRGVEITGFSIGFSNNATGALNFTIGGQDQPSYMTTSGRLELILDSADEMSICLYDIATKRAWLVSATEILLYMIHVKHQKSPYAIKNKPVLIGYAMPGCDGQRECRNSLMRMASLCLLSDKSVSSEDYFVKNLVTDLWSRLYTVASKMEVKSGMAIKMSLRQKLKGFEILDIAMSKSIVRRRQVSLKNSNGGWPSLVKVSDTLVLFGSHLGDLIKPDPAHTFVHAGIRSLPTDYDFLAMTVQKLCHVFGQPDSEGNLALYGINAHRSERLSPICNCLKRLTCSCPRLFRIITKSQLTLTSLLPAGPLIGTGCIIVGVFPGMFSSQGKHPLEQESCLPDSNQLSVITEMRALEDSIDELDRSNEASAKVEIVEREREAYQDNFSAVSAGQSSSKKKANVAKNLQLPTRSSFTAVAHESTDIPKFQRSASTSRDSASNGRNNVERLATSSTTHEVGRYQRVPAPEMNPPYHLPQSDSPAYTDELRRLRREARNLQDSQRKYYQ